MYKNWGFNEAQYNEIQEEVVDLLSRLIQVDTSNPPGHVADAANILAAYFHANGLEVTLIGEQPELMNCVTRLAGDGHGPSLLMLGHLDVVPAEGDEWTEPPFSGAVKDGYVWGRGTLDMKNQVAAQAVALARLARRAKDGEKLRGDLVFAATADEEDGQHCGAQWLLENHCDLVSADFVINEGGRMDAVARGFDGDASEVDAAPLYTVHIGEKGYATLRIVVRGRGGHGSVPLHRDSAMKGLGQVLLALDAYEPEVSPHQMPAAVIDAIVTDPDLRGRLQDPRTARAAVRELAEYDSVAAEVIEPLLGLTFSATIVRSGGEAVNVIPSHVEVIVDCRMLPGQTADDIRREVERALAGIEAPWEMDFLTFMSGNESREDTSFRDTIVQLAEEFVPGATVIGSLISGFSDSSHFRSALSDAVVYGFCPFVYESAALTFPRIHNVDERIAIGDLVLQTLFFERLATRMLA